MIPFICQKCPENYMVAYRYDADGTLTNCSWSCKQHTDVRVRSYTEYYEENERDIRRIDINADFVPPFSCPYRLEHIL